MKVSKLKQLLEDFDDDAIVIISSDGDGNQFSPLADITAGFYIEESSYTGDFVDQEQVDEDSNINIDGAPNAIALWPSN